MPFQDRLAHFYNALTSPRLQGAAVSSFQISVDEKKSASLGEGGVHLNGFSSLEQLIRARRKAFARYSISHRFPSQVINAVLMLFSANKDCAAARYCCICARYWQRSLSSRFRL